MKKMIIIFLFFLTIAVHAQRVIESPSYKSSRAPKLLKIEFTDSTTTLFFERTHYVDDVDRIPSTYFIKLTNGKKLPIKHVVGFKLNEQIHFREDGKTVYVMIFPGIDPSETLIDLNEPVEYKPGQVKKFDLCWPCWSISEIDIISK